jgi:hypothetical protein
MSGLPALMVALYDNLISTSWLFNKTTSVAEDEAQHKHNLITSLNSKNEVMRSDERKFSTMLLSLFFCLSLTANIFAQTDTEFWFAVPDLSSGHCEKPYLQLISLDQPAAVTITQPANPSFQPIVRDLAAYDYSTINLLSVLSAIETQTGGPWNTGLLIQSTATISAYFANICDNSEIYALKGRNALGTHFLIPSQYDYPNSGGYSGLCYNKVEILATEDSTDVTITPSAACVGHAANVPFTIRLHRGQTFALQATNRAAAQHLFNTMVTSTKPIAVNYTDDTIEGTGGDLVGDQLVPVNLLGTDYIAVSNQKGSGSTNVDDIVYIFPVEDATQIYINGALHATLNKGGKTKFNITNAQKIAHITSDKPITVLQLTRNAAEPGASILPALTCTGSREISYKQTGGSPRVTVITKTENIDGFLVNGANSFLMPATSFTPLEDGSGWSYFNREMSTPPDGILRISNTKGLFHAGFFDNPGTTCSFGFFSNFNVVPINGKTGKAWYRAGETITLELDDASDLENFSWTGANGFTSADSIPQIANCTVANAGMYIVSASHKEGCPVEPDTFYVHVFPEAKTEEHTICYGNTITLNAPGDAPYLWNTGATTPTITVSPTATSDYSVESYRLGSDSVSSFMLTDAFHVTVLDSLKPTVSGDNYICHGSATLSVAETYGTYLWNTGATTRSITITQAGDYSVEVTDGDCRGSGIFTVKPAPEININITKTPSVCPDESDFEIEYLSISGQIGSFDIDFANANLPDLTGEPLLNDKMMVALPQNVQPDLYNATLTVYEKNCGESQTIPLEIMVKYPATVMAQRWNDVIGIKNADYNGGYNFTAFQWYKNGIEMAGETKSYIYEKNEFSTADAYSALLTNHAGKKILTCDFTPEYLTTGSVQTLFSPSQTIPLNDNGTVRFYDMVGTLVSVQTTLDNQVVAPNKQGIYYLKFNGKIIKIVVR